MLIAHMHQPATSVHANVNLDSQTLPLREQSYAKIFVKRTMVDAMRMPIAHIHQEVMYVHANVSLDSQTLPLREQSYAKIFVKRTMVAAM